MEVVVENNENSQINITHLEDHQLLGSLTTYNNTEGSEIKSQIRSSARVFKKMKLDHLPPVSLVSVEKREKKEEIKQQDNNKKCYRPLWTSDDKTIFFEALNEYGKDFESIQVYISNKLRKRGVPDNLIKTKDQVRHLYYRTWQKVCKHVRFSDGIKKPVQELYGLINYGELRKKMGTVSEKTCMKLGELIYTGSVIMRIKGKNVRVKTPMCRALRRLNQLDEKYDEIQLPTRVTIDLRPKDMNSFLKVQLMAQNPRIRTTLPLQRRLSNLIACISKRWKTFDAVMYDKSVISTSAVTNDCVPPNSIIEENKAFLNPALRLSPPVNSKIEIPSINLSEYLTQQSICLTAYQNRAGIKSILGDTDRIKFWHKNSPKKTFRQRTDSVNDKTDKKTLIPSPTDNPEENNSMNKVVNDAVQTILSLQKTDNKENEDVKPTVTEKIKQENDAISEQRAQQINKIRQGWIEEDSQTLTIGEVYLMIGSDSKIILEYSWDLPKPLKDEEVPASCSASQEPEQVEDECEVTNKDLSTSLKKLLSVAKLHYRKNIIKCPCGHVCGTKNTTTTNNNNNVQLKRTVRKILTDIDKCNNGESEDRTSSEDSIFENGASQFVEPPVYIQSNIHPATFFRQNNPQMVHLITQSIQRLKPYCNRKGGRRSRGKQVVVERKLPLQPNKVESGHQIVQMNIISKEESQSAPNLDEEQLKATTSSSTNKEDNIFLETPSLLLECNSDNANPVLLTSDSVPSSPSRLLKDTDNQSWINSEVADFSLSSLLGHLESPMKSAQTSEDSHLSQDMDAQLHSLLTESSVDFSANFADLAAQVISETKK